MGAQQLAEDTVVTSSSEMSISAANRHGLRERIAQLIERVRAGDQLTVRDTMHNRRWREELEVAGVDSGQLAYADNLVDEAHSILRRQPENTAGVITELERAREKLV